MGVSHWNHLTRGYPDVCTCPQSYLNTEAGPGNLQVLNTVSSHGALDIQRLVQ